MHSDILSICVTMTWLIGLFFSYTKIVVKGMTKAEMILKVGGNPEFHKTVFSQNNSGLPQSGKRVLKMKNFPGQGKVREFHFQSGKYRKIKKVREFRNFR